MLNKRLTSYVLLFINLVLALFVITRVGSDTIVAHTPHNNPLTIRVLSGGSPPPDTLVLNDYENHNDMTNMYPQGGSYRLSLSPEHATDGRYALMIDRSVLDNMEMATVHFPRDWEGYGFLQFDLYNDSEVDGSVRLRIGNVFDNKRFYVNSQKFGRSFLLRPGPNTISIPMADIHASFGHLKYYKSLHFNFQPEGGKRYFLDGLRLVRQ
ncbi:MAG: hypothetical protein GY841_05825 [FCB group bacterium]|nr:hypothetical protein [FCB group bacterium]